MKLQSAHMIRISTMLGLLVSSALTGGCARSLHFDQTRPKEAKNLDELGTVNVSVVSVSRWQDVAGEMETNFKLDNDELLNQAITTTSTSQERLYDFMALALALNISGTQIDKSRERASSTVADTATADDSEVTTTSSGKTSTTDRTTRSRKTPVAPPPPDLDTIAGKAKALRDDLEPEVGQDAITRYRAAAALKQELVALNRSIRDAAMRTGYEPLLVRMSIGLQPNRREQPFDARLRVSFLPPEDGLTLKAEVDKAGLGTEKDHAQSRLDSLNSRIVQTPLRSSWYARSDPESGSAPESIQSFQSFSNLAKSISPTVPLSRVKNSSGLIIFQAGDKKYESENICFFSYLSKFLMEEWKLDANTIYSDFSGSARFSSSFIEVMQSASIKDLDSALKPCAASSGDMSALRGPISALIKKFEVRQTLQPVVIPLVATDSLEGTAESIAAEQLREASLALSATAGAFGGGASLKKGFDRLVNSEATALNSLYSISRESENTVSIRIGAMRFGRRYEMVPRTVQSTLLLLVPRELTGRMIDLVSRPSFNNARTGERLNLVNRGKDNLPDVPPYVYNQFCKTGKQTDSCRTGFNKLADSIRNGESLMDFQTLAKQQGDIQCRHSANHIENTTDRQCLLDLWAELQRQSTRLHVTSTANFQTPPLIGRDLPVEQNGIWEDKKKNWQVRLTGVDPWIRQFLQARLGENCKYSTLDDDVSGSLLANTTRPKRNSNNNKITNKVIIKDTATLNASQLNNGVMATDISLSGSAATFTFPAIEGVEWNKDKEGKKETYPKNLKLCLWVADQALAPASLGLVRGFSAEAPREYGLVYQKIAKDEPAEAKAKELKLQSNGSVLYAINGEGELPIAVKFDKDIPSVKLVARGGTIIASNPQRSIDSEYAVTLSKSGKVSLVINSIDTANGLSIIATALDEKGEETSLKDSINVRVEVVPPPE
jgi:hypothetical protein